MATVGQINPRPPRTTNQGEIITAPGLWASNWKLLNYNPSELIGKRGPDIVGSMLLDDQIMAATSFKREAILSTGWKVESPEGEPDDWPPTLFVRRQLAGVEGGMDEVFRGMLTALSYGHSITEKTYQPVAGGEDAGRLGLRSLKTKAPHYLRYELDEFGNILGIKNDQDPSDELIDPMKCILWAHGASNFGNPYGQSELEACYRAYILCNNSYRWLGLYLEKLGVPPWIVLYNPAALSDEGQMGDMKALFRDIQSAASGAIPRAQKDDIEIWTPQNAGNVQAVFVPALEHLKNDIARALLMPGHLGVSPDQVAGSYAKAQVALDMFLLSLTSEQARMAHIMQTQLVNQLVALNFDTKGLFPRFGFMPLTADDQSKISATWCSLVDRDIVTSDQDDEAHLRGMLGFPKRDSEDDPDDGIDDTERPRVPLRYLPALAPALTRNEVRAALNLLPLSPEEGGDRLLNEPSVEPPEPEPPQPGGGPGGGGGGPPGGAGNEEPRPGDGPAPPPDNGDNPPQQPEGKRTVSALQSPFEAFKAPPVPEPEPVVGPDDFEVTEFPPPEKLTPPERRADFRQIQSRLDGLDGKAVQELAASLRKSLYKQIDGWLVKPPTPAKAAKVQAAVPAETRAIILRHLKAALAGGRQDTSSEVKKVATFADGYLPTFDPVHAIAHLENKADFFVSGMTSRMTDVVRNELLGGLRNGLPFVETRNRLLDALTPYVGSPDADPKALQPDRLLTTVRTGMTDAYNQGRVVEAKRLGAKGLVTGMQHSSILDKRTTEVCRSLHGKCYRIDDPQLDAFTPPLHFRCRSILLPITLDVDVSDDPAAELHWATPEEVAQAKRLIPGEFGGSYTASKKNAPAPPAPPPAPSTTGLGLKAPVELPHTDAEVDAAQVAAEGARQEHQTKLTGIMNDLLGGKVSVEELQTRTQQLEAALKATMEKPAQLLAANREAVAAQQAAQLARIEALPRKAANEFAESAESAAMRQELLADGAPNLTGSTVWGPDGSPQAWLDRYHRGSGASDADLAELNYFTDMHRHGETSQAVADAWMEAHFRADTTIGEMFRRNAEFSRQVMGQTDGQQTVTLYRSGGRKTVMPVTTSRTGARSGSSSFIPTSEIDYKTLIEEGYVPVHGVVDTAGYQGEYEIVFIKAGS
jgi:SPP1 gp7 family putative phage head morphogenesis protein